MFNPMTDPPFRVQLSRRPHKTRVFAPDGTEITGLLQRVEVSVDNGLPRLTLHVVPGLVTVETVPDAETGDEIIRDIGRPSHRRDGSAHRRAAKVGA